MEKDCIFCQIIAGKIPCHKVYEDSNFLAFMDAYPITQGHTLVIPKKHCDSIFELDDDTYAGAFLCAKKLANPIKKATHCARVCILVEGYYVPHVHIKLIPTKTANDLGNKTKPAKPVDLLQMAQKIIQNM